VIDFLFGYSLNSKTYYVYNQSSGLIEKTSNDEFDDTNDLKKAKKLDDIGNEGLRITIKKI
jgi:hypothetical protein